MPDQTPATKQDIQEVIQRMDEMRDATKQDLHEMEDRLTEKMRDMQTEVLRAFHNWASPLETRIRHIPEIEMRLGWLEDRISAIERGEGPHIPKPRPSH